ncbi:DUF2971 domain-containing protein [Mesorhizobium sp. M0293]|uniref:DUF2971 domain-containing protein n=1 Tax=Mesorhizobium sp. M0293 TaxID=2956930 RepID=UPI003336EE70
MRTVGDIAVEGNETLWKYFRLERFLSTLAESRLYFASANQFIDPFEGAVAVQLNVPPPDPRYAEMESVERAFFQLKRLTKISCWHRAAYESDAMWKLYAGEHKGIAICTTPDRMRAAFKPFRLKPEYGVEDLWGAPVQYVDLTQVRMRGVAMLDRFFFKHRAFEWEREYRLAISVRMAEEFGVRVPEHGILVDVDLPTLIERIVLGSTTTEAERATVAQHVAAAGLSDRLELSTLLGQPRYI